jgi:AbrB family looped-hinge helix DNA binding protein
MLVMESTLTVKGQITLPKSLRDALHLKTGDKIFFEESGEGAFILRPRTVEVQMLKGCVAYKGAVKTLAEMEEAIVSASLPSQTGS